MASMGEPRVLTRWAFRKLKRIYRPGYGYHKAGIILLDLVERGQRKHSLFTAEGAEGRSA